MASRFWVGGAGTWDQTTTTHWSASTGGVGGASVPVAADDVFFDVNSGTGTVNVSLNAPMRSLQSAASNITMTVGLNVTFTIGDATAGAGNVALDLSGLVNFTRGGSTTFSLFSTSSTVQTVNANGKDIGFITYGSTGAPSYKLTGPQTAAGTVFFTIGTLDLNSQACTWLGFTSSSSNTRTLTMGSSAINITGTSWTTSTNTNMTITPNSAVITFSAGGTTFTPGSAVAGTGTAPGDYKGASVVVTGGGTFILNGGSSGGFTGGSFTKTGIAAKTDIIQVCHLFLSGNFTVNGNSATNRVLIQSNSGVGVARTITVGGTVSLSNVDIQDMTASGAAGTWTGTSLGNCLGNTSITFDTPVTQTWNANTTGTWSTAANWTSRVPLPQDNVAINALTSGTVTADMPRLCADIDFTGSTGGTLALGITLSNFGSIKLVNNLTMSGTTNWTWAGRSSHTVTTAGVTWTPSGVVPVNPGGTYTLADNFNAKTLFCEAGTLDAATNNVNVNVSVQVALANVISARTLKMGNGLWTLSGTGTVWVGSGTNMTFLPGNSTIIVSNTSSTAKTFTGAALAYNNLQINGAVSAAAVTATGANTFNNITGQANAHLTLPSSTTTTISGLTSQGTAGNLFVLDASTAGTAATLSSTSRIATDFLSVKDSTASGNTPFYAGANGTLVSGDTNWLASAAPPLGGNLLLMGVG